MKDSVEQAVLTAKKYYQENNLTIPNNVVEYIANFPKGLSRQMLSSKYGIKCSEFIKLLNPTYEKPLKASRRVLVEAERLGYKILSDISTLTNNRDKVDLECTSCGYNHTTTITSMSGSLLGCPKCKSGNLAWSKRAQELDDLLLDTYNSVRISDIPANEMGYLTVKHLECNTEYTSQLLGFVNPNTKNRGTCPNCRDSDKRVTINGITFGSQFEADCYNFIKHLNPELHVKYSNYFNTKRKWVCDFKIDNYWIEVSNFKTNYKNYFQNIQDKENLIESNGSYFFFITSLKEMENFASIF